MNDDLELTLAAFVGAIAVLVAVPFTIRLWRNELPWMEQPLWPRSHPATERALARAMPVAVTALTSVALGFICRRFLPEDVGLWCAIVGLAISALLSIPMALIVLINRPRALVPPHLRDQLGYVSDRRRRRT